MNISGFEIKNFKGIRSASINFAANLDARVHTLVGLNESGKTTLLEAIHSFSPDSESEIVVKNVSNQKAQIEQWVPRDKIANFTGDVSVTAHITATKEDWTSLKNTMLEEYGMVLEEDCLLNNFTLEKVHRYKRGDYVESFTRTNLTIRCKSKKAKIYRETSSDQHGWFMSELKQVLPTVAYYPTFVFDFPKCIYLTQREENPKNDFYRQLFQDILDYTGQEFTIEEDIVNRLHNEHDQAPWEEWFPRFSRSSDKKKIDQIIAHAEEVVSKVVFTRWNEVFGEPTGSKQVVIEHNAEPGQPVQLDNGTEEPAVEHDIWIKFKIKDGTNTYDIDDRSLGFRWFFFFLLFTHFRVQRAKNRPTIFLFDEPASNLHASAQKKLLESFPAIANAPHRLIYSTHSHYMVEPKWLEQAYIIKDNSANADGPIIDERTMSTAVDVAAIPYRKFVNDQPDSTSYFQPVLDALKVQPSKFDYKTGGIIAEGKSDFYYLNYFCFLTKTDVGPIFPGTGSGTLGALVSLHRGWGLEVRVLFDKDQGGKDGKKNLKSDFQLGDHESCTLSDLFPKAIKIEDIISDADQLKLTGQSGNKAKPILMRVIQENLAAQQALELSEETIENINELLANLSKFRQGD